MGSGERDGIVVLSPAKKTPWGKPGGGNSAQTSSAAATSTQKRVLEMKLKISRWTRAARKNLLEMFHRLQQRIGVRAGGWLLFTTKLRAQRIQSLTQSPFHAID